MTDLMQLLSRHATQSVALAAIEAEIKKAERTYWTDRGYTVMPRRERLIAALKEDAARPTPLEKWLEDMK